MLVLVVDDDADFRTLLGKALEARGHSVEMRESAFGLTNRVAGFSDAGFRAPRPDVIVLDHMLPGLPGADSLDLLATHERTRDVPVLLVSNGFQDDLPERAKAHAFCRFVGKTGRMLSLVDALEGLVAESVPARQGIRSSP